MKRHIASWQAIAMPSLGEAAPTLAMLGALGIGLFAYKLDRLAYFTVGRRATGRRPALLV